MKKFNSFLGIGVMGLMIGLGSVSMVACGDDDDDDNVAGQGGKSGAAGKAGASGGGSGGSGGASGGGTGGGGTGGAGASGASGANGAGGSANLSLYDRLGGKMGVRGFVTSEVNKVLTVPALASYFGPQVATPIPAGSPSKNQLIECFARLLGKAVSGPGEEYPGAPVNDPANTNNVNFTCRTMAASHANLRINGDTFDAFVTVLKMDIAAVVTVTPTPDAPLEVTAEEVAAIAGVLDGTKADIVDEALPNDGMGPDPQPAAP